MSTPADTYDVLIIGGGVIGCAVLRAATLEGWKCVLVESESHLLSHARSVAVVSLFDGYQYFVFEIMMSSKRGIHPRVI